MHGSDCVSDPFELTEDLLLLKIMLIPSTLSLWDDREDSFPSNRSSNSPTMKNSMIYWMEMCPLYHPKVIALMGSTLFSRAAGLLLVQMDHSHNLIHAWF